MISDQVLGIGAALVAPLAMDVGIVIWDEMWTGHANALNLFKCSVCSVLFVITMSFTTKVDDEASGEVIAMLLISATIGIIIGDNIWLQVS